MGLTMTFWPNPVYRNHAGELRWYFHVSVRQEGTQRVHVWRYRGEWYDMETNLQETKEDRFDLHLVPYQHVSYPDLWVTSAVFPSADKAIPNACCPTVRVFCGARRFFASKMFANAFM